MKVLIVVDMQNDFIDGALGTPEACMAFLETSYYLEAHSAEYDQVIFTRDTHCFEDYSDTIEGKNIPIHCIKDTDGWKIPEILLENTKTEYHIYNKFSFGYSYSWHYLLWEDDEITIIGLCTDICVITNALMIRAERPTIPIRVIGECCAGTTPENHEKALDVMRACLIEVI